MPRLADVAQVLEAYRGRYDRLDAFVDDIEELASPSFSTMSVRPLLSGPRPSVQTWVDGRPITIELFQDEGFARFRLGDSTQRIGQSDNMALGAALGGALGGALGVASEKKEGLLGGLVLGILVGSLLGAATTSPVERALALRFDPESGEWRLYGGPLLSWAKRALVPAQAS